MAVERSKTNRDLRQEILAWIRRTRGLLLAAQAVVEWYGTEDECQSFAAATIEAKEVLKTLLRLARSGLKQEPGRPCVGSTAPFRCSESTAIPLSPILEILATPVPEFIDRARQELPIDQAERVALGFGLFCGAMVDNVYGPFWKDHGQLAPPGWPL